LGFAGSTPRCWRDFGGAEVELPAYESGGLWVRPPFHAF
jgi:hypothetical protein